MTAVPGRESFLDKIRRRPPILGTLATLPSPEVAEMLSLCGFDWLMIDMEHGPISTATAQRIAQAIRPPCSALLRIPENAPVWIKQALDTGCDGIVVPMVNSTAEAQAAVRAAKYPPLGERSVGIARAHGYGASFADYIRSANESVALIIQIEHTAAVEKLDEILDTPGIDGVLIGPYDLSGSLNLLGEVGHEAVQSAINRIKQGCVARSLPVGIFSLQPEEAAKEIADGCRFLLVGTDTAFLTGAARRALEIVRQSDATQAT